MGKGTDKLYITHSEWASGDAFGASSGSGIARARAADIDPSFRNLPFGHCALSLQPFKKAVCSPSGIIFDRKTIFSWLEEHDTNPVDGSPLKKSDLFKVTITKNAADEFCDPVTFKAFTNRARIVVAKNIGQAYNWATVQQLNIKANYWQDLCNDNPFTREDLIFLQDPQSMNPRNVDSFKHLIDSQRQSDQQQEAKNHDPLATLGSTSKILKAKEAVAKARADRANNPNGSKSNTLDKPMTTAGTSSKLNNIAVVPQKALPYNAAQYTTGKAAASFTSTGVTPHTSNERALLTEEEFMLKPGRVKGKGYARLLTSHGEINVELYPEYAPKAVWNFVHLAKNGCYKNLIFHRNIRNFMIQGGDPTGTGRGGTSVWSKNFADEFDPKLTHDSRGILSMANKGKDTNSSQFFILYRAAKHLDRKHTIFGKVVDGLDTLTRLESVQCDAKDKPVDDIKLHNLIVFLDPFEEFLKQKEDTQAAADRREDIKRAGGTEDDKVTWSGKRLHGHDANAASAGVGKYMSSAMANSASALALPVDRDDPAEQPVQKKIKAGAGFGNFDGW